MDGPPLFVAALCVACLSSSARAQEARPYLQIHASGGNTLVPLLGDEDRRTNYQLGLQYAKPDRVLKWRHKKAELVQELYYEHSHSPGASGLPANVSEAIGYLAMARYNWICRRGYGIYFDVGLGLQYDNRRSVDLPSRLNSTPVFDLGMIIPAGKNALTVGARFMHISNAHQVGSNQGQNQLFFDVGLRF